MSVIRRPDEKGLEKVDADPDPIAERGTLGLSEEARQEAQRRYPVVAPLAAQELVSAADARAAAALLGVSSRSI